MIVCAATSGKTAWANGAGLTRQIAVFPPNSDLADCLWRISVADIAGPADFSALPGIDRILVLLEGVGLKLQFPHTCCEMLRPLQILSFKGEAALHAQPAATTTQVLNIMARRGAVSAQVRVWYGSFTGLQAAQSRVWFVANGSYVCEDHLHAPVQLNHGDALISQSAPLSCMAKQEDAAIVEISFTNA